MKHVKILSYKVITFHFMSDIHVYIRGEAHIQLYVQYSSFVQYQTYSCFNLVLLSIKNHATSSLFSFFFFNIKFIIFFSKTYFTKSVRNVKIAFLYNMKHVKILSYKVITLHFMYDIYTVYMYI